MVFSWYVSTQYGFDFFFISDYDAPKMYYSQFQDTSFAPWRSLLRIITCNLNLCTRQGFSSFQSFNGAFSCSSPCSEHYLLFSFNFKQPSVQIQAVLWKASWELECFFFFPSTSLLQHFQLIPECCHSGKNYVPPYIYIIHVYHWSKLGLKTPLAKIKCVSSPSQEWKEDVSIACHTATHLTETGPRATRKQKAWLVYKRP